MNRNGQSRGENANGAVNTSIKRQDEASELHPAGYCKANSINCSAQCTWGDNVVTVGARPPEMRWHVSVNEIAAGGDIPKGSYMKNNSNTIVLLAEALQEWRMRKTSYYLRANPDSAQYDPDLPCAFPLGSAVNSPRAFTREEVDGYTEILVRRGKEAVACEAAKAAKERANLLVAARRARLAERESQARG